MDKIKSYYGQIDAIKGKAQLIAQASTQGGGSMFTGQTGEDEMRKSFLSDIKTFIGSIAYKGG